MTKIFVKINKKAFVLALFLSAFFVFYASQCVAFGFVLDCYGPGCDNDWCNLFVFTPFQILLAVWVLAVLLFTFFPFGDKMSILFASLVLLPVIYLVSLAFIKIAAVFLAGLPGRKEKTKD